MRHPERRWSREICEDLGRGNLSIHNPIDMEVAYAIQAGHTMRRDLLAHYAYLHFSPPFVPSRYRTGIQAAFEEYWRGEIGVQEIPARAGVTLHEIVTFLALFVDREDRAVLEALDHAVAA